MPFATVHSNRVFYRLEGKTGAPVLVFSHSIGTDHGMWAQQAEDLLPYFQVLRYDIRGHGASDVPVGEYSIEELGQDVIGLTDAMGIRQFAFCGISLGGAVGQWLALNVPERMTRLILANTSPQFGPRSNWDSRRKDVLQGGMPAIADISMERFFSTKTLAADDPHANAVKSVLLGSDPAGYAGCCSALRDIDFRDRLKEIRLPTLVIAGDRDLSTPWQGHGEILAREIPGAESVHLNAAHLSNLERPRSFTTALLEFLQPCAEPYADPLEVGFEVRRAVLGDAHVDNSIATTTDLNREFQEFITRYAWGTIWTRPGLSRRTRRLLVFAIVASLGRWEEFRLHVRAGLIHEMELCDLKEVLLQTAIYAGVPAANTGFHIMDEELEKLR